jgi:5-methyltetrahydrofolate--homocysteine methyltransferase
LDRSTSAAAIGPFPALLQSGLVIADGAMGTMLQAEGLPVGECPELWNIAHPERVAGIHRAYIAAGAQIVLTNTFGGSRPKLARYGLASRVGEMNRAAVEVARSAGSVLVAASVGPTGHILEPYGEASPSEVEEAFAEQMVALADADVLWIETMTDLREAHIAVAAARSVASRPVAVTFTFEEGARGPRTMMGVSPEDLAQELPDADVVGVNCGTVDVCLGAIAELRKRTDKPLAGRPNAGRPRLVEHQTVFPTTPERFAEETAPLQEMVAVLGGCCGTTPQHIRALSGHRP